MTSPAFDAFAADNSVRRVTFEFYMHLLRHRLNYLTPVEAKVTGLSETLPSLHHLRHIRTQLAGRAWLPYRARQGVAKGAELYTRVVSTRRRWLCVDQRAARAEGPAEVVDWTLEVTKKGERGSTLIGRFHSQDDAMSEAERLSPNGIHWTALLKGRHGTGGDCQYLVLKAPA